MMFTIVISIGCILYPFSEGSSTKDRQHSTSFNYLQASQRVNYCSDDWTMLKRLLHPVMSVS